jgi:hypothetical protein
MVSPTSVDYWVSLPTAAAGPNDDGSYEIDSTTDLPDGTVAYIDVESTQSGSGFFQSVDGSQLVIGVANNDCTNDGGVVSSVPFTLRVSVAPDYRLYLDGPPPPTPHWQPDSVYAILGDDFQNLTGPDVTKVAGMNILQVSGEYQLPSDTCTPQ